MFRSINSSFKRYNANSKLNHTSDCVCRSISVALGQDYDATRRELLRYVHKEGYVSYRKLGAFQGFMKEKGYEVISWPEEQRITIEEFCERYPRGIYVCICGDRRSSKHAVCVINGDFYDTWDCSQCTVEYHAVIQGGQAAEHDRSSTDDKKQFQEQVALYIEPYIDHLMAKMPYADITKTWADYGPTACVLSLELKFPRWEEYNLPQRYSYDYLTSEEQDFYLNMNPRMFLEDNVSNAQKKLHVQVREWLYQIRKEIDDEVKMQRVTINPEFRGNRTLLQKLPESAIPHVLGLYDDGGTKAFYDLYGGFRYECTLERLPDDPRTDEYVSCQADSFTELKRQIQLYLTSFKRFDQDY